MDSRKAISVALAALALDSAGFAYSQVIAKKATEVTAPKPANLAVVAHRASSKKAATAPKTVANPTVTEGRTGSITPGASQNQPAYAYMTGQNLLIGDTRGRLDPAIGRRLINLKAEHSDPMEAIINLLGSAGVNYVIGGDPVGGRKVTAQFRQVPLADALDALADAAGISYHARGKIVVLVSPLPLNAYAGGTGSGGSTNFTAPVPDYGESGTPNAFPAKSQPDLIKKYELLYRKAPDALKLIPRTMSELKGLTDVMADDAGNALIATGDADALSTMDQIVKMIDAPSASRNAANAIRIFELKYRLADDVLSLIPREAPDLSGIVSLAADANNNSLIVTGDENSMHALTNLLSQMDKPPLRSTTISSDDAKRQPLTLQMHLYAMDQANRDKIASAMTKIDPNFSQNASTLQVVPIQEPLDGIMYLIESNGGQKISSPTIMTLSGVQAAIRVSASGTGSGSTGAAGEFGGGASSSSTGAAGGGASSLSTNEAAQNSQTISVLPKVNPNGSVTLDMVIGLETHQSDQSTQRSNSITSVIPAGQAEAIWGYANRSLQGDPKEPYLLLLKITTLPSASSAPAKAPGLNPPATNASVKS